MHSISQFYPILSNCLKPNYFLINPIWKFLNFFKILKKIKFKRSSSRSKNSHKITSLAISTISSFLGSGWPSKKWHNQHKLTTPFSLCRFFAINKCSAWSKIKNKFVSFISLMKWLLKIRKFKILHDGSPLHVSHTAAYHRVKALEFIKIRTPSCTPNALARICHPLKQHLKNVDLRDFSPFKIRARKFECPMGNCNYRIKLIWLYYFLDRSESCC